MMTWEDAFKILEPIPTPDYPGGRWPSIRYYKMRAFFELAQGVGDGCIVELGAWRGLGTCALALGAPKGVKVYTVDDYKPKIDHLGFTYHNHDIAKFDVNIAYAGVGERVKFILDDVIHLSKHWDEPIGLLVWDLGIDQLAKDFADWERCIIPDGIFAYKDLEDRKFGNGLLDSGRYSMIWQPEIIHRGGCVWSWRKYPKAQLPT